MTLPPLPLPAHTFYPKRGKYQTFSADQMHAYGEACAAAEMKRVLSAIALLTWHQRDPKKWCSDDVAYAQGYNQARTDVAAAIRAQEKTP